LSVAPGERTNINPKKGESVMATKQSDKIRPVEEVRIAGIKAAIWRNEGRNGAFYNVTFQRLYRGDKGQWGSTATFGAGDLLVLAKVANAAHSRVLQLLADQRQPAGRPAA
jgi:hypothetical protein